METKTEAPELTRDLISKAADIDVWLTLGALQAIALAPSARVESMRAAAAKTLTGYIERAV